MRTVYSYDNENSTGGGPDLVEQQKLAALQEIAMQLTSIARKMSDQNSMLMSLAASLGPKQPRP